MDLAAEVASLAHEFSGVVRVDRAGTALLDAADAGARARARHHGAVPRRAGRLPTVFRAGGGGYLADGRTNVFHLPVVGNGDGGLYTRTADMHRFWRALFSGVIVSPSSVALMTREHSDYRAEGRRYGLGFWLDADRDVVILDGYDAGVSFRSLHDPADDLTTTVVGTTSDGAWPIARLLAQRLGVTTSPAA